LDALLITKLKTKSGESKKDNVDLSKLISDILSENMKKSRRLIF